MHRALDRALIALTAFTAVAALAAGAALAQEPRKREIHLIHMGGNDCPPCVAWRNDELPRLQQSAIFRTIRFSYVNKSVRATVPPAYSLPDEVRPYKDLLDAANGRNIGSPQTAILVDGKVYDYYFGARSAPDMEAMLASIRDGTPYPYPRCVRRGAKWACEDGG